MADGLETGSSGNCTSVKTGSLELMSDDRATDEDQPMMNDSTAQFKSVKCRIADPPSHFDHHHSSNCAPDDFSLRTRRPKRRQECCMWRRLPMENGHGCGPATPQWRATTLPP